MEKLIIDTDLGFDCDDAGALALAFALKNEGETDVLAVTHSVNRKIGGEAISLIADYYGNGSVPVGVAEKYAINVDRFYDEFYAKFRYADGFSGWKEKPSFYKILDGFDLAMYNKREYPSADSVIIDALARSGDGEVTMVCIGQANNVAEVLERESELYRKKVKNTVVMCGNFTDYNYEYLLGDMYWKGEFNVILDVKSAQKLFADRDLPVCVLDFNQGFDVLSGSGLAARPDNPALTAYKIHGRGRTLDLPSWDLMTVMFATGLFGDMFSLSACGKVKIDDNGKSTFSEGSGKHRLIYRAAEREKFADAINEILTKR